MSIAAKPATQENAKIAPLSCNRPKEGRKLIVGLAKSKGEVFRSRRKAHSGQFHHDHAEVRREHIHQRCVGLQRHRRIGSEHDCAAGAGLAVAELHLSRPVERDSGRGRCGPAGPETAHARSGPGGVQPDAETRKHSSHCARSSPEEEFNTAASMIGATLGHTARAERLRLRPNT
jgi:hypothetical protein